MTLIAFQSDKVVFHDGKVRTVQQCCCNTCRLTVATPIRVTLSNFSQAAGYFGSPSCDCYEGTYTIEALDTIYRTDTCPPTSGNDCETEVCFTDAYVTVEAYEYRPTLPGGFTYLDSVYVRVCWRYTTAPTTVARCQYYRIPYVTSPEPAGFDLCAITAEGTVTYTDMEPPEGAPGDYAITSWSGCEGDIAVEVAGCADIDIRTAPTLSASAGSPGSGATFTVSIAQHAWEPDSWRVSGITASGGSGYTWGQAVTVTAATGDVTQLAAVATIQTVQDAPELTAVADETTGSGASLTVSLEEFADADGRPMWRPDSVSVTNGGSGYQENDLVVIAVTSGTEVETAYASVSAVDGSGAITSVGVIYQGSYYGTDTGAIDSVLVSEDGAYWHAESSCEENPLP